VREPVQFERRLAPQRQWSWPLVVSSPERAILEFLYELPEHDSFHQADMLMEGLSSLSPARLQPLLADCRKVKRLFLFFAGRHNHAWLKHLDRGSIDLGRGKRMVVKGGLRSGLHDHRAGGPRWRSLKPITDLADRHSPQQRDRRLKIAHR
jgi:Transcriptional regulator, AbiEi antitoxin, Type IV TA system